MAALFPFEVHTPYRRFFEDSIEAVVLTLADGEAGIYAGHSPFTAPVNAGILKIKDKNGVWKTAFTTEGILEVKAHKTVFLSDAAEWPDEIDYERAKKAKERAEEIILSADMRFEINKAKAALKRAEGRIKAWESGKEKKGKIEI